MANEQLAPVFDMESLNCLDCGGFPIDDGSVFVAAFLVRNGKPELGGICERCWLRRLEKRGQTINRSSSGSSAQFDIPLMGLYKTKRRSRY